MICARLKQKNRSVAGVGALVRANQTGETARVRQQRFSETPMRQAARGRQIRKVIFLPYWINIIHRRGDEFV
jgi:hypothetical protein